MAGPSPSRTNGKATAARSPRRRAREFALQGLYQWQLSGNDEAAIEAHLGDVEGFDKADREFFVKLLRGVLVLSLIHISSQGVACRQWARAQLRACPPRRM